MSTACPTTVRPTTPHRVHTQTFQLRAFVSILLIASGVIVLGSGILLLLAPTGRLALTTGWSAIGLDRQSWVAMHDIFGLLWIPLLITHGVLNRKPILCYLKGRVRKTWTLQREALAAVAFTVALASLVALRASPIVELLSLGGHGMGR